MQGGYAGGLDDQVLARTFVALRESGNEIIETDIRRSAFRRRGACEIEKLVDGAVDVFDILRDARADGGIAFVVKHFNAKADARERCAQIVRYAGEQQCTLIVERLAVGGHLIECVRQRANFCRAAFVDRRGRGTASHKRCGFGKCAQRPVDARHNEISAAHRQQQHQRTPADPAQGFVTGEARFRHQHPKAVAVYIKAHPNAFDRVARQGEFCRGAQLCAQVGFDKFIEAGFGQRREHFAFAGRMHLHAFAFGDFAEQAIALGRLRGNQRRAREVDRADDLLRYLARARLARGDAKNLQPGQVRQQQQRGNQQHAAGEQGLGPELHFVKCET